MTRNLFEALSGIVESESFIIWIDAICINQVDDEEKGWQVALMGDIYRQTSEVIAWLGPSAHNSDAVLEHLDILGSISESLGLPTDTSLCLTAWKVMLGIASHEGDLTESTSNPAGLSISLHAFEILLYIMGGFQSHRYLLRLSDLDHLFRRQWWSRIWVLQEITLPEQARMVCGAKRISRRRFHAALKVFYAFAGIISKLAMQHRSFSDYQQELLTIMSPKVYLMVSMSQIYQQQDYSLLLMLRTNSYNSFAYIGNGVQQPLGATDPRDKVFALLGLVNDKDSLEALGVFPDYTKSKEEVYTTTMTAMLRKGHISLLSICCGIEGPNGLPSWVPDWSKPDPPMLQLVGDDRLFPTFNACGSKKEHNFVLPSKDCKLEKLLVYVKQVDEVLQLGHVSRLPSMPRAVSPVEWLDVMLQLAYYVEKPYLDVKERMQTAARASHAGMRIGKNNMLQRACEFPEALTILEEAYQSCAENGGFPEFQNGLIEQIFKYRIMKFPLHMHQMSGEILRISDCRVPLITKKGHLGISSMSVKEGDLIVLVSGAQTPFILRRTGTKYMVVGEAYIDGIMDGEAAEGGEWFHIELE